MKGIIIIIIISIVNVSLSVVWPVVKGVNLSPLNIRYALATHTNAHVV